jgi:uncharacterized membrane protein/protein-disulfide isomerase
MKKGKIIEPLPFPVYFWTMCFLAVAGLANAAYLSISHYRVYTDIGYRSFCAISRTINCDTVSQSPYSILVGLPVPVWGIIGYLFVLLLLALARHKDAANKRIWSLMFLVALAFSIYSVILALISTFIIHSYCIMCIVSYAISFLLLFYAWIIRKRFKDSGFINGLRQDFQFLNAKKLWCLSLFAPFLAGILLTKALVPAYWQFTSPPLSSSISVGTTGEGHPWIGADKPELTITEFADYQCFQCKKMHFFLRQLVAEHPDKIRLVHRHFPMDHEYNPIVKEPFHVGSGKMALLAIYAAARDRFWEMNDMLFENAGSKRALSLKELADRIEIDYRELAGSIQDQAVLYKLYRDIWKGLKLEITGTPAYLIDDKIYLGQIPTEILKNAIKSE